jgi:anhydro-N-acetylmuramic acid kinase
MDRLLALAQRDRLTVVGLMSGTSADGIDACVAAIGEGAHGPEPRLVAHRTYAHDPDLRRVLLALGEVRPGAADGPDRVELVARAHFALGRALGGACAAIAREAGLAEGGVDLVGSHGQTIRHLPAGKPIGAFCGRSTLQIGEASCIAEATGAAVVSDFRVRDVAAGGQGAPLVPHVDRLLFSRPGRVRAIQNFGGIGNVTYLPDPERRPAGGAPRLVAFDTGPGNMVIDALVRRITGGVEELDADGVRARRGRADRGLVDALLADPFLAEPPPRTAGREQYGAEFTERFWRLADERGLSADDRVATATAFTAEATAASYRRFLAPLGAPTEVIVSGGGSLNPAVMESLARALAPAQVVTSAAHGIPVLAKEALAFAVLAYEFVRGRAAGCPEATGATRAVVLGKLSV